MKIVKSILNGFLSTINLKIVNINHNINKNCECKKMRLSYGVGSVKSQKFLKSLPRVPTLIDIGIGESGTNWLWHIFPGSKLILIDPLEECFKSIDKYIAERDSISVNCALGASPSSKSINVTKQLSCSSFFLRSENNLIQKSQIDDGRYDSVENRTVPVRTLDEVVSELTVDIPLGIKIDTEGYEMEVLKGAYDTLEKTKFVIIEFHGDTPIDHSLQDIIGFMNNNGFSARFMLADGKNIAFVRTT